MVSVTMACISNQHVRCMWGQQGRNYLRAYGSQGLQLHGSDIMGKNHVPKRCYRIVSLGALNYIPLNYNKDTSLTSMLCCTGYAW